MVEYSLTLTLPDSSRIKYAIDLSEPQEGSPDNFFTPRQKDIMKTQIRQEHKYLINDNQLNKIVLEWQEDIREGYRDTVLTVDLPSSEAELLKDFKDLGNQAIRELYKPDIGAIQPLQGKYPPIIL